MKGAKEGNRVLTKMREQERGLSWAIKRGHGQGEARVCLLGCSKGGKKIREKEGKEKGTECSIRSYI